MSARIIKGDSIDDGAFPLPPDKRAAQANRQTQGQNPNPEAVYAEAGVEPAEMQHALSELREIVGMISGMRPNVQELSEALRSAGHQSGYADGKAQGEAEVHGNLVEALSLITASQNERHRLAQENEAALADLGMTIARRVIGAHLEEKPELIKQIVSDTIAELEPSTALEVRVAPSDLEMIEASRAELERMVQGAGGSTGEVTIVADDTITPGGVVLVSPVGEVDARVETKLSVLETAFRAQRRTNN